MLLTSLAGLPQARSADEFSVQLTKPVRASQLYNALLSAADASPCSSPRPRQAAVDDELARDLVACGSCWRRTIP